jgi:NAD(P)-dependent dehydrogenase (short-subunit alcohol dehydrogenase family)
MHPEATHEVLKRLNPIHRLVDISDIAAAVLYLESAPFVNGEILHVDGGSHAGKW